MSWQLCTRKQGNFVLSMHLSICLIYNIKYRRIIIFTILWYLNIIPIPSFFFLAALSFSDCFSCLPFHRFWSAFFFIFFLIDLIFSCGSFAIFYSKLLLWAAANLVPAPLWCPSHWLKGCIAVQGPQGLFLLSAPTASQAGHCWSWWLPSTSVFILQALTYTDSFT